MMRPAPYATVEKLVVKLLMGGEACLIKQLSQGKIIMRKPGDWDCRSCQHLNFSRRDLCQQCGEPRPGDRSEYGSFGIVLGGGGPSIGALRGSDVVRPGDWYCSCGYHNFASRANCLKCGGFKDESATGFEAGDAARPRVYNRVGWKTGDWICSRSGCNVHNYASRMECFRCHAPRDAGTE
ncbi:hypothetical protein Taro_029063 [Colocasia esculenta]|uniref:RanBP2-type domain-containing protein n=1 Tax=Colocasia esculenta TaxID=4460 RepID=A0A843VK86_COLES|nr:hypothetical protein [Colocasia esculenta]